ncbi:MAG: hypothetical protein M3081_05850 [Gemmatimonadota bacterium]|nr:hypothetical protein [Gemmatimonadota bacterium]
MTDPIDSASPAEDAARPEGAGTGVVIGILVLALVALAAYFALHHLRR